LLRKLRNKVDQANWGKSSIYLPVSVSIIADKKKQTKNRKQFCPTSGSRAQNGNKLAGSVSFPSRKGRR
jgi:hypothetical protein